MNDARGQTRKTSRRRMLAGALVSASVCTGVSTSGLAQFRDAAPKRDQVPADRTPSDRAESDTRASEALARLAQFEKQLESATGAERQRLASQADEARRELLEGWPNHDRASTWLVDRAAYALALLGPDGADTSVLLGLPSIEQRQRVLSASRAALALLGTATTQAQNATVRLESVILERPARQVSASVSASGSGAISPEIGQRLQNAERELHRLVDIEQAQRIPYLTAVCRVLSSAAGEGDQTQSAQSAASAIQNVALRTPALESARDVLLACAILNATPTLRTKARDLLVKRLENVRASKASDEATRHRAGLALIVMGVNAPASSLGAPWSVRLAELEADARRKIAEIGPSSARRWELTASAAEGVLKLANDPTSSGAQRDARRAIVYAKVGSLFDPASTSVLSRSLSPEVNIARAVALLSASDRPSSRAEALLEEVGNAKDTPLQARGDALWELCVALQRRSGEASALARQGAAISTLIRTCPGHPRRIEGAEWLARNASPDWACLAQGSPGCGAPTKEYIEAITLLSAGSGAGPNAGPGAGPDTRNLYVRERVRVLLWGEREGPTLKSMSEAITLVRTMPASSSEQEQAQGEVLATIPRLLALQSSVIASWKSAPPDKPALLEHARALQTISAFARQARPTEPGASLLDLASAECRLLLADGSAATAFHSLLASEIDLPASRESARIRLGLAHALRDAAREDEAFKVLRELSLQFEKAPGEVGRDEAYWEAWCQMIEILARTGGSSRRDEVLANINRLELVDQKLGGPAFAARINAARQTLSR